MTGTALGSGAASATDRDEANAEADENEVADADDRPPANTRSATYRACSFNIRYDNPDDDYPWDERLGRIGEAVTEIDPDLLGVQEALPNQYDDLRAALDDYEWYGVGREDGDRSGEMVPVAWRADRFDVLDRGEFWLSETPGEPSVGWDADLPRVTTWARLRHRESDRRVWLCSTHFSHVSETARVESAALIHDRVRERAADGDDVVVTGDCNARPSRRPYRVLTGTGDEGAGESSLFDPRREAGTNGVEGPWGTYHGFTNEIGDRIDYVLTLETATVKGYRTLDVRDTAYRSDHLPVVAEFAYGSPSQWTSPGRRTERDDESPGRGNS
ncbi:endonuclease/exonuclease/phosphatase family protein [Natrinema salifodinae]|uniref:endonuclease/exonuclease/phosphatase family protein n=1 Tax=Natrinema salifodinae TaxID=1202768 RepID=UPI001F4C700E|nr:endonuclease/exonuclease/phosphatase family protein [Natrinema salifodinae]